MPFGAQAFAGGTRFRLWAPSAASVELLLEGAALPMRAAGEGFFEHVAASAGPGSRYAYRIDGDLVVPDPASRFQPDGVTEPGLVVDPAAFAWTDSDWRGRPWREAVIWEAHVGTATPEGTYAALAEKLDELRELGITAVELMPLAECPGDRNWGYDGVLPFAPRASYGTPDDLRRFVDRAHALGIMVLIDVVYNHFGPSGNYLHAYAEAFFNRRHHTLWGAAINFDAPGCEHVRDFFVHNALYWIEEFHFDGIRFDAVHAFADDSERHFLDELASRIRAATGGRNVHLVLENERNEVRWLERGDAGRPKLYDAQWNDDFHHCWHVLLTGEHEAYYEDFAHDPVLLLGRCLAEGFAYQGEASRHQEGRHRGEISRHLPGEAFVAFLQNHDQVGNRAFGERLAALADPDKLSLAHAVLLLSPQIPMLFMGEEWSAEAPFQFFVDFPADPELSRAVRDGRRQEFRKFAAFADPAKAATIPDPTDRATFERSKIDWQETSREAGAGKRSFVQKLIALRRREIWPLLASGKPEAQSILPGECVLDVHWDFPQAQLSMLMNLGARSFEAPEPRGSAIFSMGVEPAAQKCIRLAPWSLIVSKDTRA